MIASMGTIDKLISSMTLEEKLGQLTMITAGYAVTGPVIAGDSSESVRNGRLATSSTSSGQSLSTCSAWPSKSRGSGFR